MPVDLTDGSQAFGDLLRRHRVLAGMSQEELAEKARLSARAISDLERGVKRTPRRDTVQLLVEALGLSGETRTAFVTAAREPTVRRPPRAATQGAVEEAPTYPQVPAPPAGGFLGAVPEGSLIGRRAELGAIQAGIEAVFEGPRGVVAGPRGAGVGENPLSPEGKVARPGRGVVVGTRRG